MDFDLVQAPVSLLLDPRLTPAAKVLWLASRTRPNQARPTQLAANSGLTLATIRKGLAQLEANGWYSPATGASGPGGRPGASGAGPTTLVSVPAKLLADTRVRPQAKLFFGLIQVAPGFRQDSGEFTYVTLSEAARVSDVTARQIVLELAQTRWIDVTRVNPFTPLRIKLPIPDFDPVADEVARAARRLEEWAYSGEAFMKEYLSLLIESDDFEDNARPGFLVNPLTGERLELDRYYPPLVGFEYHGVQHYRVTERYPSEHALAKRQARDLMKIGHCALRGIRVVIIHREHLRLQAMREKAGTLLPLRDLTGHEALAKFLDQMSTTHIHS